MPEFTPGPWSLGTVAIAMDDGYYEATDEAVIYYGPDENEIRVEGQDARANALLIASAPELYAALAAIVEPDGVASLYTHHLVIYEARRVLRQARGENNDANQT